MPAAPDWLVPLGPARTEITVLNSRFVATLEPVASVAAARAFVQRVRAEFPDATHHVPAFIVGGGRSCTEFCSDDGEPAGTSGRPLLAVLRGSNLGNVAVVVTRYFGGTLLGTGGLVKAYTEAGQAVLACCHPARQETVHQVMLAAPYQLLERLRLLVAAARGSMEDESFGDDVTLVFTLPCAAWSGFCRDLAELSSGSLAGEIMQTYVKAVPLA